MTTATMGQLVLEKRKAMGLTQEELARRCELDTRTIQRIEKDEVKPYFSTLKLLSRVMECDFISMMNNKPWRFSPEEESRYLKLYKKRRAIRIVIMVIALAIMLAAAATFPTFRLFGMAKLTWAPFFYLLIFGLLIAIGITWRCPVCNSLLGDPFRTPFCQKCGFRFR